MARSSLTPDQLQRIFDEAPSSNVVPSRGFVNEKFYTHPPLLPGEQIITQQDHVTCVDTFDDTAVGILHITTYRVIFAGCHVKHILDEPGFVDAEPEEVARRGHHHQTRSRQASFSHQKLHAARSSEETTETKQTPSKRSSAHDLSKKIRVTAWTRGVRHSQSVIRKNRSGCNLPGMNEQTVRLQTLRPRPIILSNIEHVDHSYEIVASVPLSSILDVKKFSKKNLPKDKQMFLMDGVEILCSNIQSYRFCLGLQSTLDAESLMKIILENSKTEFSKLFAFVHKSAILLPKSCTILDTKDAPNFYKFELECDRLKLFHTGNWRICREKQPIQYPAQTIIVPISMDSKDLTEVANFHRGGCVPAVCWRHVDSGAVLLRSSTTLFRRGLKDSRCEADEKYLEAVSSCSEASTNKLVVFTEQLRQSGGGILNSSQQQVTQITGQLTPAEGETFYYHNTKFVYGEGIPDFKAVKQSAYKLQAVLSSKNDDSKWLSSLEDSDWLSQVSELLQTATQISVAMECDKSSVLISYEDGVDRTAQLSSLSQLLLDPYYRTVAGFQVLIQKEWLSFGHRFYDRTLSPTQDEHSPVFLQWLDCVWQVMEQFPFSFEFNSLFLEVIAEHVYSSRFGTFIVRKREEKDIEEKTTSLWTWLNVAAMSNPDEYKNMRYKSYKQQRVLHPHYRIPYLKLWSSHYLNRYRYDHVHDASKAAEIQALKLVELYKTLLAEHSRLIQCLATVDSKDGSSKMSFSTATLHRALQKNSSNDHLDVFNHGHSNSSLDLALDESEEDPSSMTSLRCSRRMTRSRSLDDMLDVDSRHRRVLKKTTTLKRRVGSSKFYTEQIQNAVNKESRSDVRNLPISEKYSNLKDYLHSTGIVHESEKDIKVSEYQCCGYMVKQGQVRRNWKKRWFVLDLTKKYLAYFETEKADIPKGAISCKAITSVYEHPKCGKSKHEFLFCVDTPDRTYTMYAPSEHSMKIWMTCLTISPTAIELQRDQT